MSELLGGLQDRSFARATPATALSYPPERRLTAGQLASYLDRRAFAVVGSTRGDGRPHAAMSVYVRRGTIFWLPTMAGSVRERNLRGKPWLTMVIAEGDHPVHIAVIAEGPAETVAPSAVPEDVRAAVTGDWVNAWIRVEAERMLSYADEGAAPLLEVRFLRRRLRGDQASSAADCRPPLVAGLSQGLGRHGLLA